MHKVCVLLFCELLIEVYYCADCCMLALGRFMACAHTCQCDSTYNTMSVLQHALMYKLLLVAAMSSHNHLRVHHETHPAALRHGAAAVMYWLV